MTYLLIKAVLSAVIIVAVSEIARRNAEWVRYWRPCR